MIHRASAGAGALGIARIAVFGMWFLVVAFSPLSVLAELPLSLFNERGVIALIPPDVQAWLLDVTVLQVLKGALLAGCALLVLGVRPYTPLAITTTALLLLFDGLTKSFNGFVNHAQIGILYAAMILALFPAADAMSIMRRRDSDARSASYAAAMATVPLVMCCAYAFIGTNRIIAGGVEIFTGDAIVRYMAATSLSYSYASFTLGLAATVYPALATLFKLGFAVTTCFEILSPLCLVSSRFRLAWLAVIVPFHAMTLLTMNIFFWENLVLILVFFTPIPAMIAGRRLRRPDVGARPSPVGPGVAVPTPS